MAISTFCLSFEGMGWMLTATVREVEQWLADVPGRIAEHPARRLDELLPWNSAAMELGAAARAA